jgi:polyhydroxyalkanoate synthesis regulator protein
VFFKGETMETIKKFKNRKLYSKTTKGYVTLTYLVDKIKRNETFQVVEHGTNNDITAKTLKQALSTVELSDDVVRSVIFSNGQN